MSPVSPHASYAVCFDCAAVAAYSPITTPPPAACGRCQTCYDIAGYTDDAADAVQLSHAVTIARNARGSGGRVEDDRRAYLLVRLRTAAAAIARVLELHDAHEADDTPWRQLPVTLLRPLVQAVADLDRLEGTL